MAMASVEELEDEEEEEEEEEVEGLEPLLYDQAKWVAWAVEEKERSRREEEEKARKREENRRRSEAHDAVMDSIIEHDPKVGRDVYTRFFLRDFSVFNIDEECKWPLHFSSRCSVVLFCFVKFSG